MPQVGSRKRPAPGTCPEQSSNQIEPQPFIPHMGSEQYPQWTSTNQPSTQKLYPAPSGSSAQPQFTMTPQQQTTSNELARRPPAQESTGTTSSSNGSNSELWPSIADNGVQQSTEADWPNSGDDLDQKALLAKMDAQTKRKQIPPFVQKLSRYACFTERIIDSTNAGSVSWTNLAIPS